VVAFLPNLTNTGSTLILAGTDSQATEAGGEFLTSNDALQGLLDQSHSTKFPHFQILLRTARMTGTPLSWQIISYRIAPR
jgi:hypothetical protein